MPSPVATLEQLRRGLSIEHPGDATALNKQPNEGGGPGAALLSVAHFGRGGVRNDGNTDDFGLATGCHKCLHMTMIACVDFT